MLSRKPDSVSPHRSKISTFDTDEFDGIALTVRRWIDTADHGLVLVEKTVGDESD